VSLFKLCVTYTSTVRVSFKRKSRYLLRSEHVTQREKRYFQTLTERMINDFIKDDTTIIVTPLNSGNIYMVSRYL